jgi:hypothetical protein
MKKYKFRITSSYIMSLPDLVEIRPSVLDLKHGQSDMGSRIYVHFVDIVRKTHNN